MDSIRVLSFGDNLIRIGSRLGKTVILLSRRVSEGLQRGGPSLTRRVVMLLLATGIAR